MRVLIVDDSSFIREYLRRLLQRMGVECREAGNGREALEVMRADEAFDLMLLDLNMPEMNGLECVNALRSNRLGTATKVMMVTTEADYSFICQALEYGADEFLMKPFTPESLKEKMSMLGFEIAALRRSRGRTGMQKFQKKLLRILVADDSPVMRGIIRTLFVVHRENGSSALPAMELCGEAHDGVQCLEMVRLLHPDVLLLDLEMPRMHGLGVLDRLREECPELPVIMCSAYTEVGARSTVDALAHGAADYVMKPSAQSDFPSALRLLSEQLLPKIAALVDWQGRRRDEIRRTATRGVKRFASRSHEKPALTEAIVIGASTGGPLALETMLPMLPSDLPIPVLVVQHMPKLFTGVLAERLDRCCALRVREAYDGAASEAGTVWLAPGDFHMELMREGEEGPRVFLHKRKPLNYCRPSVDYLFSSAAQVYGAGTLAVVMTGMGSDGLAGARNVHEAGGTVLTQDEASSVVWGMPGRVTESGIASATLPLISLGTELARRASLGRSKHNAVDLSARRIIAAADSESRLRIGGREGRVAEVENVLF
jgi:two-component system chemotaxis response regulator CheB